jgi:hypothetical protein
MPYLGVVFSGLQLICLSYAGFELYSLTDNARLGFSGAYVLAPSLHKDVPL